MKIFPTHPARRGFTLIELLVAMAITTIIASVLISVTAIAIDSWTRSRAELRAARQGLDAAATRTLRVQYFALLRDQAGRAEESLSTTATTASELYAELAVRHGFTLAEGSLKVAINTEFANWSQPLAAGDTVVFIPPVAGG